MKKVTKQVSSLSDKDLNVNLKNENQESLNLKDTSINDVSSDSVKGDINSKENNEDDDPWKWGNMWDWYIQSIRMRWDYLNYCKIPKIDFLIGMIIYHFVEVLEEGSKCKYIDLKALAFDHSSLLESRRPISYYSLEEVSKLTGIHRETISKGVMLGYFLSETINGMTLFTEGQIQFIRSFAPMLMDAEKRLMHL